MPTIRLSKSTIDGLPVPPKDVVFWDDSLPGFGVKVTPKGKKVFIALYRTGGAGSRLRKYTIGPYGRITLHGARAEAQKVFAAKLDGRDPATEKREGKRRLTIDRVEQVVDAYDRQRLAATRSRKEIRQLLDREVVSAWRGRSVHEITKRDVMALIGAVEGRGTPYAANKLTKVLRAFLRWCVGRGILERSPADGIALPFKEKARERTLNDDELASILAAARQIGSPYGGIVELLALTGQRREEVAQLTWGEIDLFGKTWTLGSARTKNGRAHLVHLSEPALDLLQADPRLGSFVFTSTGRVPFQNFTSMKLRLDTLSGVSNWRLHDLRRTVVSGMAALGVAPHVADRILNHVGGTIGGVAAVYQRHEFLAERKAALDLWGAHVSAITNQARRL
ncbi:MAG: site-specific integrase [Rhizobiales bacterium]|nr:site-specific integrase [Hyphomicrobiales bacterium]